MTVLKKYGFGLVNLCLIGGMIYFAQVMVLQIKTEDVFEVDAVVQDRSMPDQTKAVPPKKLPKIKAETIVKRNLFDVLLEQEKIAEKSLADTEALEKTRLNLKLWGTVTGEKNPYAVIEDKKLRKQALYEIGDEVQGAKIKRIEKKRVVLIFQGRDQMLELEEKMQHKTDRRAPSPAPEMANLPERQPQMAILKPSDLSADLATQIRFRPHFSKGVKDGLMLYGIRPNSVFKKIGLRNGDILKDVNKIPVVSSEDAAVLFELMQQGRGELNLTVMRRGKLKQIVYKIEE